MYFQQWIDDLIIYGVSVTIIEILCATFRGNGIQGGICSVLELSSEQAKIEHTLHSMLHRGVVGLNLGLASLTGVCMLDRLAALNCP